MKAVNALLAAGVDVTAKYKDGLTPLHVAEEGTPLHLAAVSDHAGVVEALLAAGGDVNAKDEMGWTPLHWAAVRGQAGATKALIAGGAKVNARTEGKLTPLDAARLGMEETEESVKPFQEVIRH